MQTYLSTKVACQITRKHGTSGILNLFESTKLEHKGVVLAFLQMQFLSPGCKTKMPLGMPTPRGLLIFMPMQNLSSIPRWLLRFLCGTIHVAPTCENRVHTKVCREVLGRESDNCFKQQCRHFHGKYLCTYLTMAFLQHYRNIS